jgi:uncharacterized protein YlxP (DUF503 family)
MSKRRLQSVKYGAAVFSNSSSKIDQVLQKITAITYLEHETPIQAVSLSAKLGTIKN